jgi:peptidoglycan/LPS O-acetylase OafA/YrhL
MNALNYRPDIDGLRTLAVVPVILFHAGATWLPGGFVGVDIFFVISGYLISSIILRESAAGEFSFLRFYERRLRRIIPALLAVLVVTVAIFQVIALPDQAQQTAESGIAALLSVSNFYFWRTSGYFAPAAEFMPLLHTWTLAVEEQFYLLFPVVVLVLLKLRLSIKWVFVMGTVAAFALGYWLSLEKPSVAYYLLPARAWELAIGAVLAVGVVPAVRGALMREFLPAFGIGLIVFSMFYIRSDMLFPGWVALMPCLGTAMVIHAGGQSWVAQKILAARPMVFVGLLSYSLYLWHWPVLTALRVRTASVHLDLPVTVGAITITFLLAWVSWRYVERPFRNKRDMPIRRMLGVLGAGSAVLLIFSGITITAGGFPARLSDASRMALVASTDIDPFRMLCDDVDNRSQCRFGPADKPVTYAIIGDSHAAAIRPAIEYSGLMGNTAGTLYWTGGCPFLIGANMQRQDSSCTSFKDDVWTQIEKDSDINTIILAGRWPYQVLGSLPESGGSYTEFLIDAETVTPSVAENSLVFVRGLKRSLDRLEALGVNVIIIGSVPEPGFDVPRTVALSLYAGKRAPQGSPRSEVAVRAGLADELLARLAAERPSVDFIPIWETFCGEQWCEIERDGVPIYYDDDHLSYFGARTIAAPAIAAGVQGDSH